MSDNAYWDEHFVLRRTFFFHPFTQTAESDAGRLTNTCVVITKTCLYYRPYVFHDGCHVFTATFDRHTEGKHRTTADVCIRRLEVLLNNGSERGEDLSRGESSSQTIDYSQCRLENASGVVSSAKNITTHATGCIFIRIFGLRFGCDGHKPLQDRRGETLVLNLGLLTVMGRG